MVHPSLPVLSSSYVAFIASFCLFVGVLCTLFLGFPLFVKGLGFAALCIEAALGFPQVK